MKLEVSENKFTHTHLMLKSKNYFLNCNYVLKVYNVTLLDLFILASKREIKKFNPCFHAMLIVAH